MYYFKLYYDSTLLTDSSDREEYFEEEEEAMEEAEIERDSRIEQWKIDGGWNTEDSIEYFDIVIEED